MGSCVSIHRNPHSAMKLKLSLASKTDQMGIHPSPIKHSPPVAGSRPINGVFAKSTPTSFVDNASKDETFFDSRAWLDSDCEDDFYSVNGDFTPSRGNTPVHHNFSGASTPRINQLHVAEDQILAAALEPSPIGKKKKKLAELFRESSRNGSVTQAAKPTLNDLALKSNPETPYMSGANSVCGSERTPNGEAWAEKERPFASVQRCLPSLISCPSFSDRRKKTSPAVAVNE